MDQDLQNVISSLPVIDWKDGENVLHEYEGHYFERVTPVSFLEEIKTWVVREDDIFVISYPKTGNTWLLQILYLIWNNGDVSKANETSAVLRNPCLEMSPVMHYSQVSLVPSPPTILEHMPSPRVIKTHLPATALPRQVFNKKPKIIYVARNPKDVAGSYYHFTVMNRKLPDFANLEEFLKVFCQGKMYGGDYLEEAMFWWEKRHDPNVLFMKYEDMKRDHRGAVAALCNFLDVQLSGDIIDQVVKKSTFEAMKANPKSHHDADIKGFMRKGKIGDWKNYFTVVQDEVFSKYCQEKLKKSTLSFDYE